LNNKHTGLIRPWSHVTPGINSQTQEKESIKIIIGMTGSKIGGLTRRVGQLKWCGKVIVGDELNRLSKSQAITGLG
jgi:hypothetical protein